MPDDNGIIPSFFRSVNVLPNTSALLVPASAARIGVYFFASDVGSYYIRPDNVFSAVGAGLISVNSGGLYMWYERFGEVVRKQWSAVNTNAGSAINIGVIEVMGT